MFCMGGGGFCVHNSGDMTMTLRGWELAVRPNLFHLSNRNCCRHMSWDLRHDFQTAADLDPLSCVSGFSPPNLIKQPETDWTLIKTLIKTNIPIHKVGSEVDGGGGGGDKAQTAHSTHAPFTSDLTKVFISLKECVWETDLFTHLIQLDKFHGFAEEVSENWIWVVQELTHTRQQIASTAKQH